MKTEEYINGEVSRLREMLRDSQNEHRLVLQSHDRQVALNDKLSAENDHLKEELRAARDLLLKFSDGEVGDFELQEEVERLNKVLGE